jgi:hypothetical protein
MSEVLYLTFTDPEQAKRLIGEKLGPYCRDQWAQGVECISVSAEPQEETTEVRWFREYWGYVLKPISEQAQVNGMGADSDGWHLYYKRMFLGYTIEKVKLPGSKRWSISRRLKSTRKLTAKARRQYIEEVRAHAATTFAVEFPVPPWATDLGAPVKGKKTAAELADKETGEIIEEGATA